MATEKKIPTNTVTRDLCDFAAPTGNIYETVVILAKRSNQIALAEKKELNEFLDAVKSERDTMEEVVEMFRLFQDFFNATERTQDFYLREGHCKKALHILLYGVVCRKEDSDKGGKQE